jgi:hypothetical protein
VISAADSDEAASNFQQPDKAEKDGDRENARRRTTTWPRDNQIQYWNIRHLIVAARQSNSSLTKITLAAVSRSDNHPSVATASCHPDCRRSPIQIVALHPPSTATWPYTPIITPGIRPLSFENAYFSVS